MNTLTPIHTLKTECQDCYKCVRFCDCKAIKIEDGNAVVIPEACVYCGTCVTVCPPQAKRVRNDLVRARYLLSLGRRVIASIAPSFVAEFGEDAWKIPGLFRRLGFAGVSETALGAEMVSAALAGVIRPGRVNITSACPVVTGMVRKYYPSLVGHITPIVSPARAHARELKRRFGADTEVVFVGPCVAKKLEADEHPDTIALALSFQDIGQWIREDGVDLESIPLEEYITERSGIGGLYPLDGGMIATLKNGHAVDAEPVALSGLADVRMALDSVPELDGGRTVIMELLACRGGCVNGPLRISDTSPLSKRMRVLKASGDEYRWNAEPQFLSEQFHSLAHTATVFPAEEIKRVLATIGKNTAPDELNCGGCGYDSCREFATAILAGKAERAMCVTYMRRLAQKKANALIKSMPSGVVITGRTLEIIECNANFAAQFIEEGGMVFRARPGLEGAQLEKILPDKVCALFRQVLETGDDISESDIRIGQSFYHVTIFSIETGSVAGAIFQDVTSPMMRKKNVVDKARKVITKNLETVQTIAALLGENAASTEVLLNSIIESYSVTGESDD